MPKAKNRTRRNQIKPLGVSERLGDAPPSRYVRGASGLDRPRGADTYTLNGAAHRYDGKCHADCENVR